VEVSKPFSGGVTDLVQNYENVIYKNVETQVSPITRYSFAEIKAACFIILNSATTIITKLDKRLSGKFLKVWLGYS